MKGRSWNRRGLEYSAARRTLESILLVRVESREKGGYGGSSEAVDRQAENARDSELYMRAEQESSSSKATWWIRAAAATLTLAAA